MNRGLAFLGLWVALAPAGRAQDARPVAAQARDVLRQHCSSCHYGEGSDGAIPFDVLKHADLTTKGERNNPLIVPGQPARSYLLERVVKGQMPPGGGRRVKLSAAEKA